MEPSAMTPRQLASASRRLAERVDRSGGPDACWPWTRKKAGTKYGRINVGHDGYIYAHRLTVALSLGRDLRSDEFVMHSCDNPPCCNPAHLVLGDLIANNADARAKGLLVKPTCRRGHEKTPENTYEFFQDGYLHRQCRECVRENYRARAARRRT